MRLLVLTDQWSPDVVGGSARVAADTAHALARRGHEVTVLAPARGGLPPIERHGSLEVRRLSRRGRVPQTLADVVESYRLARRARGSVDVVLAHQSTNATGALAARVGAPLALVFHASVPLEQRFMRARLPVGPRAASLALAPAFAALEHLAVHGASRILVLSDFSRGLVAAAHPAAARRVVNVGGGIDATAFAPHGDRPALRRRLGLDVSAPLVVAVRRLEPRMGLEQLLRALALLRDRGRGVLAAIAGDGVLGGELRALARQLRLDDDTRFLGRVPQDDLRDLFAAADLSVVPTLAYEGFGIATVESLMCGTPVVGTRVGATPELLDPLDPALVADRAEPESLADAIAAALDRADDAYRGRCAAYARSRFAWEHAIAPWEAALAGLAAA